jgi:SAM-dependent methyltransferase
MENSEYLKSFFTEHWKYMAVSTACQLNIFDQLITPKSSDEVATILNLHAGTTAMLLKALSQHGFLKAENGFFETNDLSVLLTEDHPETLKYACMNWSAEHLDAWQMLDYSIIKGKSSFEYLHQQSFFDYLNCNPDKLEAYHNAMYEYARDDYKNLAFIIDFGKHKSIIDVGGGYGAAIQGIKNNNPHLACALFDLQQVVEKAPVNDVAKYHGNFFDKIPDNFDAIILARVLHDWDDTKAALILKNCYLCLNSGGVLYVIENCSNEQDDALSLLSLNMTAMCESFERTEIEYMKLCQQTGFIYSKSVKLNRLQTILIFDKK